MKEIIFFCGCHKLLWRQLCLTFCYPYCGRCNRLNQPKTFINIFFMTNLFHGHQKYSTKKKSQTQMELKFCTANWCDTFVVDSVNFIYWSNLWNLHKHDGKSMFWNDELVCCCGGAYTPNWHCYEAYWMLVNDINITSCNIACVPAGICNNI